MKKVKAIWIALLSCVVALAFIACGGNDDSGKDGKLDGTQDPSDIQSEKVTAAQWAAAFDFDDVHNITVKIKELYAETETEANCAVYKFDGDKVHYARLRDEGASTTDPGSYQSKENGVYYQYEYDAETQTWRREQADVEDNDWGVAAFLFEFEEFAEMYPVFSYDNNKKAYTFNMSREHSDFALTVKFVGGKLAVVEREASEGEYKGGLSVMFYDYGTTSVTLPQVSGDSAPDPDDTVTGPEVTEEQWRAALGKDAYRNVTVQVDYYEKSMTSILDTHYMQFDLTNERFRVTMSNDEIVAGKYQDKYVMLQKSGSLPSLQPINEDIYKNLVDDMLTRLALLADKYDEFTYDAEKEVYTAAQISLDESVCRNFEIAFEDGKCVGWKYTDEDNEISIAQYTDYGATAILFPGESAGDGSTGGGSTGDGNTGDQEKPPVTDPDNKDDINEGGGSGGVEGVKPEPVDPEEPEVPETNPDKN